MNVNCNPLSKFEKNYLTFVFLLALSLHCVIILMNFTWREKPTGLFKNLSNYHILVTGCALRLRISQNQE